MNKKLDLILKEIATLREIKGKEKETLELIEKTKPIALDLEDYGALGKLYWEESLKWQHFVMNEASKENPDMSLVQEEKIKMLQAAKRAHEIITKHNLSKMLGTSHRFLGNSYRVNGEYDKAEIEFREAIQVIEQSDNPVQSLEVRGFLASVLVLVGKTQEGIDLAEQTFKDFQTKDFALKLKDKDYVTWGIWASGIFPRLTASLVETGADFDKKKLKNMLKKSEEILKNPQKKISWGDPGFKYRIDEITKAKNLMETTSIIVLSIITAIKGY